MNDERLKRGLAILREADEALAGFSCPASTECCRFSLTGREPWLTQIEWELVAAEVRRSGRRLPSTPADDDGRCPFLDETGHCRVYAARPLGCRTYFCDRAQGPQPLPKKALRRLPGELLALTVRSDKNGNVGARSLRSWLREARDASPRKRSR